MESGSRGGPPKTDRHERIRELFVDAVDLPSQQRGAFLDQACGADADLRAAVERLIAADSSGGRWGRSDTSDVPRLSPGTELAGRFRVLRFIAAGGMGDVYEVEDLELHEHVALKTIRPEVIGDARVLARFKREIHYAKRVTHPNVCRIYDLGSHREGATQIIFLTMEMLQGETLAECLRSHGRMTPPEALPLIIQMAEALSAAHEAGIIHRDFKTSNVILAGSDKNRKAVVTDFGLACSSVTTDVASLTETGRLLGTLSYMAPEQLTHGEITPATDVYSLGLVMYEMVTGHKPFEGDTPIDSAMKRLSQPPSPPRSYVPGLDSRWEAVILQCLELKPKRRFQRPAEVKQALTSEGASTETLTAIGRRAFSRRHTFKADRGGRPSPASNSTGTLLGGRYLLQQEIGRGGFGVVYLAMDQQLHSKLVVVKLLLTRLIDDPWRRKRFHREVEALSRINHPGIILMTDVGETPDGRPYFVMEYVKGDSLRSLISKDGMDFLQAAGIIRQIGLALHAAHECGVWHRDVKPENILVQNLDEREQRVKVIDFGIAIITQVGILGDRSETRVAGSFHYMAPEQLDGKPEASSDIYALGVIAFELITGRRPFSAETPVQLHGMQRVGPSVRPRALRSGLNEQAERLLLKALQFRPADRHITVREFGNEFAAALEISVRSTLKQSPEINLGRMVAKMCDRRAQEDDFKQFLLKHTETSPGQPQLYFIHGEEGECHESLVERLTHSVDRIAQQRFGESHPAIRTKKIPWQHEGTLESRRRRIVSRLFDQMGGSSEYLGDAEPSAFGKLLSSSVTRFLVLQHEIRAARWDDLTTEAIASYRDYLAEASRGLSSPQILAFFSIIYPGESIDTSRRFFPSISAIRQRLLRRRVLTGLKHLGDATRFGSPSLLLDELRSVTHDDVMEWFGAYDVYESEDERLKSSAIIFGPRENLRVRRRMSEIEIVLTDLHQAYIRERGYA
jgi:serine/threonine protein kinase